MRSANIILASRNASKIEQIKEIFAGLPAHILSLDDAGITDEPKEDGDTVEQNALKKARFAWRRGKGWCVADDTGFFIDALDGLPGVRAARWAGAGASAEDIMHFTLEQIAHVPAEQRTARFKTVAAVVTPSGAEAMFTGIVNGFILMWPRTARQIQMPYSAIFAPDGYAKVWAEMTVEEENAISHRGKAFRQARAYIERALS